MNGSAAKMTSQSTSLNSFRRTANPQLSSLFFTLLPAEIRNLIYLEFWRLSSLRLHIILTEPEDAQPDKLAWGHLRCITDPNAKDLRFEKWCLNASDKLAWTARLRSEFCLHWECEERSPRWRPPPGWTVPELWLPRHEPTRSPFPDVLTTCKRMYLECLPSLYSNTTFVFTDTSTVEHFLSRYGGDDERYPLRSLELCIRATNLMTELYFPTAAGDDEGPPAIFAGTARPGLSMSNNPWQRVCDLLAGLPSLQALHIWFDSRDLRPWHKRVSEIRFFRRLFDVRVANKDRFVLALPELPDRRGTPDLQVLEGHYLEGKNIQNAPFTVVRGPRPNNWRVLLQS
ncbi:hypothetical protein VTK56DRAFT_4415 [Thermocarpiscus australiensis]